MTLDDLKSIEVKTISKDRFDAIKSRWDGISKPLDGLGDFEKIISKLHAIVDLDRIEKLKKVLVIMCADHGVVAEGVSQCGQEVTLQVTRLLGEDISTASSMARFAGVDVIPVDIGVNTDEVLPGVRAFKVGMGTRNFANNPAMTIEEVLRAISVGIELAKECKDKGYHILATGEMGIGNTTSNTALLCALTGVPVEEIVGRGAGLSDAGLDRKTRVIKEALEKYNLIDVADRDSIEYVLDAMSSVGGYEIAGMTGLFIGGACVGLPVMIDGVISATAALCAARICPEATEFMLPSHSGRERGTGLVLDMLGLKPLINGDMALGEGTGALMALPLLDMALDFFNNATTFVDGGIEQYTRQN